MLELIDRSNRSNLEEIDNIGYNIGDLFNFVKYYTLIDKSLYYHRKRKRELSRTFLIGIRRKSSSK
jgi:hypothetical protein